MSKLVHALLEKSRQYKREGFDELVRYGLPPRLSGQHLSETVDFRVINEGIIERQRLEVILYTEANYLKSKPMELVAEDLAQQTARHVYRYIAEPVQALAEAYARGDYNSVEKLIAEIKKEVFPK